MESVKQLQTFHIMIMHLRKGEAATPPHIYTVYSVASNKNKCTLHDGTHEQKHSLSSSSTNIFGKDSMCFYYHYHYHYIIKYGCTLPQSIIQKLFFSFYNESLPTFNGVFDSHKNNSHYQKRFRMNGSIELGSNIYICLNTRVYSVYVCVWLVVLVLASQFWLNEKQ